MDMDIYVTRSSSAKYCDEPGVEKLGNFSVVMTGKLYIGFLDYSILKRDLLILLLHLF
jgi:hypothetical protein